jgi:hypothetical protein
MTKSLLVHSPALEFARLSEFRCETPYELRIHPGAPNPRHLPVERAADLGLAPHSNVQPRSVGHIRDFDRSTGSNRLQRRSALAGSIERG